MTQRVEPGRAPPAWKYVPTLRRSERQGDEETLVQQNLAIHGVSEARDWMGNPG